jgi:C-terminal processing protease CtpA/Prc
VFHLPHDPEVAYLADTDPFTVHELDDDRTLYLRYRLVDGPNVDAADARIGAGDVDRLILDLRQNPGGDNGTYGPLLRLVQAFAADHPGATTVLTDRVTFSAAANLATEIEQSTDAVFIGEPMGGGLNFWNDVSWVDLRTLPIPMRLAVSTRYWEMSTPDDPRLTIEPDVAVPVTAEDYLAGRDPALEAALAR